MTIAGNGSRGPAPRDLALPGRDAFVVLSTTREEDPLDSLTIAARFDERGVCVADLDSGDVAAFLHFQAGCTEILGIGGLPGLRWPAVIGSQGEAPDGVMIAPPGA